MKEKILSYLTEPRTINDIKDYIQSNYSFTKKILMDMRDEGTVHAYKNNHTRLMNYYIPQPHPLQTIFGHTANFADAQIKSITIHNADDAKHNLQHNTTQETFEESITYTLGNYE